mmetsp:Transcript_2649/g.3112  ORF Transcript_2649/g.3112 Transcript_2649/m.3112 type:complete len:100 (-) Transcript_2649:46-345(-)
MSEVEERLKRIEQHKGVKGIMIINDQNQFVKCTMPEGAEANKYGIKLREITNQARDLVRSLDSTNDLTFLRITCTKYEMMIAPNEDYYLIVVQIPNEDD